MKLHLERDLVDQGLVINREVEIHRTSAQGSGESTDILVSAIARDRQANICPIIHIVVECKCSWSDDLKTGMKKQLKDRYLIDDDHRYGLYLVGWFDSDRWDEADHRKKNAQRISVEDAADCLKNQANALSDNVYHLRSFVLDVRLHIKRRA